MFTQCSFRVACYFQRVLAGSRFPPSLAGLLHAPPHRPRAPPSTRSRAPRDPSSPCGCWGRSSPGRVGRRSEVSPPPPSLARCRGAHTEEARRVCSLPVDPVALCNEAFRSLRFRESLAATCAPSYAHLCGSLTLAVLEG